MGVPLITAGRAAVEWWTAMVNPGDGEVTLPGCVRCVSRLMAAARTCGNTGRSDRGDTARPAGGAASGGHQAWEALMCAMQYEITLPGHHDITIIRRLVTCSQQARLACPGRHAAANHCTASV